MENIWAPASICQIPAGVRRLRRFSAENRLLRRNPCRRLKRHRKPSKTAAWDSRTSSTSVFSGIFPARVPCGWHTRPQLRREQPKTALALPDEFFIAPVRLCPLLHRPPPIHTPAPRKPRQPVRPRNSPTARSSPPAPPLPGIHHHKHRLCCPAHQIIPPPPSAALFKFKNVNDGFRVQGAGCRLSVCPLPSALCPLPFDLFSRPICTPVQPDPDFPDGLGLRQFQQVLQLPRQILFLIMRRNPSETPAANRSSSPTGSESATAPDQQRVTGIGISQKPEMIMTHNMDLI